MKHLLTLLLAGSSFLYGCSSPKLAVNPWQITILGSVGQNFTGLAPFRDYPLVSMTFREASTARDGKMGLERVVFRYDSVVKAFNLRELKSYWSMGRSNVNWTEEGEDSLKISSSLNWMEEGKVLFMVAPEKEIEQLSGELAKISKDAPPFLIISAVDLTRFLRAVANSDESTLTFVGEKRDSLVMLDDEHKEIARHASRALSAR